jgi:hypothetical protein
MAQGAEQSKQRQLVLPILSEEGFKLFSDRGRFNANDRKSKFPVAPVQIVQSAVWANCEGMEGGDIVLRHSYKRCGITKVLATDSALCTKHVKVWCDGQVQPTSLAGKSEGVRYLVGKKLFHFSDTLLLGVVEYNAGQIPLQRFG